MNFLQITFVIYFLLDVVIVYYKITIILSRELETTGVLLLKKIKITELPYLERTMDKILAYFLFLGIFFYAMQFKKENIGY